MALVAYEYSDSSDEASENEDDKQTEKSSIVGKYLLKIPVNK